MIFVCDIEKNPSYLKIAVLWRQAHVLWRQANLSTGKMQSGGSNSGEVPRFLNLQVIHLLCRCFLFFGLSFFLELVLNPSVRKRPRKREGERERRRKTKCVKSGPVS